MMRHGGSLDHQSCVSTTVSTRDGIDDQGAYENDARRGGIVRAGKYQRKNRHRIDSSTCMALAWRSGRTSRDGGVAQVGRCIHGSGACDRNLHASLNERAGQRRIDDQGRDG